jgi:tetratricopeptide (TPR) repeat protein
VSKFAIAHLDEIEEVSDGRCPWRPVRHRLGITAFGVSAWTAGEAGDRLINEHDESDDQQEELYLVTQGRARFELDGESRDAPVGTFVSVLPGVLRTAFAEEPGTTLVAIGGVSGKPYEPHGYHLWAPIKPLYDTGRYAEAADRGRAAIEAEPQLADAMYNLACCESLAGRTDEALRHLRRSIELSEPFRAWARDDSDFAPIRENTEFKELVGG